MLILSGTKINLKSLRISVSQQLAGEDKSGASSGTDSAETGDKAKILHVTGTLPFTESKILSTLFSLACAKDKNARLTYRISNKTATALKITQVKFQGALRADEDATLRIWSISFELAEHISVAEREEKKEKPKEAAQQKVSGVETPAPKTPNPDEPPGTETDTSLFMQLLKNIDDALA